MYLEMTAAPQSVRYSWIARTPAERARTMALHARFVRVNRVVMLTVAACVAPAVFIVDRPVPVAALACFGFGQYAAVQQLAPRRARPELWLFWSLLVAAACIAGAVVLSGLTEYGALGLLIWPASGLASRFPTRAVIVGTAAIAGMLIVGWAVGAPEVLRTAPVMVSGFVAVYIAVAANISVLRLSDTAHHSAATVDELTRLPNRVALRVRADELEAKPQVEHSSALILLDIDHFKTINDEHGHQAGDDVLAALGLLLSDAVRGDDTAYRLGGEEFAVLVRGAEIAQAIELAQRLLDRAREATLAGHRVTLSAGVAVSPAGQPVSWKRLFARADAALYQAKEDGRDRVKAALGGDAGTVAA